MSFWKDISHNVGTTLKEKNALIALGGAGVGYCGTVVLAIRATQKAEKKIEQVEAEEGRELTLWERIKTVWTCYIPTACLGVGSTILLCYAGSSYEKQKNAALAAAAISETAFKEFREAVAEKLDGDKLQEVYQLAAEKKEEREAREARLAASPDADKTQTFVEPCGMHEFTSTKNDIRDTVSEMNHWASPSVDGYYSVTDLCCNLNCVPPGVGKNLIWDNQHGFPTVTFDPCPLQDGTTGWIIVYSVEPHWDRLG